MADDRYYRQWTIIGVGENNDNKTWMRGQVYEGRSN